MAIEPSMMAQNTLNGYRGTGEGHWLDNADADTLRDMVRIAAARLTEAETILRDLRVRDAVLGGDGIRLRISDFLAGRVGS